MQDLAPFQAATDQLLRSIGLLTSSPSAARSLAEWIDDVIQRHHDASGDSAPQMKRYLFETDGVSMLISSLGKNGGYSVIKLSCLKALLLKE